MYELLREGSAMSIALQGRLTRDDLADLNSYFGDAVDRHGRVQVLVEVNAVGRDVATAFVDGLQRHLEHGGEVDRVAFVGDEGWDERRPEIGSVFPEAEVQTYRPAHLAEAWAWVRGKR